MGKEPFSEISALELLHFFTPALSVTVLPKWEIERGHCLEVRAEIGDIKNVAGSEISL